ncbi:hypothetical protein EIP91_003531 [Steccherinum ochraceum]|uniref:Uncharacterized protein n=1 Tax=Steccherinum ochraceum TaxID=92696 RepID=A0A4R0RNR4_9APHY|nr:hypothetical protein EIP91_003531 [Steccherinum ochraceum]
MLTRNAGKNSKHNRKTQQLKIPKHSDVVYLPGGVPSTNVSPATTDYLIPHSDSNPSYDTFYIHQNQVILLQMTMSRNHKIKESGLNRLADIIKSRLPERCSPTQAKPWWFVWVVPHEVAAEIKPQEVISTDAIRTPF